MEIERPMDLTALQLANTALQQEITELRGRLEEACELLQMQIDWRNVPAIVFHQRYGNLTLLDKERLMLDWLNNRRLMVARREGLTLIYQGWLPRISNKYVHPLAVYRLMKCGRRVFGELPPMLYPTTRALVQVIRVLGRGQKPMDRDKIALTTAGLVDALTPSYIRDDGEKWADITYRNDASRRHLGPRVEIEITYEEV